MAVISTEAGVTRLSGAHRALSVLPLTALLLDAGVIGGAIGTAAMLRGRGVLLDSAATVADVSLVGLLLSLGWLALIALRGGYETEVFGAGVDEYKRVAAASALTAGLVGIACYLAKYQLSRGFFLFAFLVGVPTLILGRYLLRRALHRVRRQGLMRRRVLIVGATASADEIAGVLRRETWLGYEVMGALTPAIEPETETPAGVPVIGNTDDVASLAPALEADLVFFAGGGITSARQMRHTMWALEDADIHVVVAPSMTDIASERVKVRPVGGLPLIHVGKPRATHAASWAKRSFDLVGALTLLLLATPVLAASALRIRAHDGGPILFRQARIGRDGETFRCLKLRTMVGDAEDRLADLHKEEDHREGLFKMEDDPRITTAGRLLRRYSIDELPQLWNVLRGEMSLVGPRPPLPSEVATYDSVASRRLRVRPGLTGLWQVSGRSNLSWDEAIRLDVYYVDNWSMLQDLSILVRTVRAVVGRDGAY